MLERAEHRAWALRIASSLAIFVLGWILLALVSSTWFQPSEVQKLIEEKLPVLKIFHPDMQAWLLLRAWQPILALLLAALALAYSKSLAEAVVEQWWRAPPDFLGLPAPSREVQDFRSRATSLVGREAERAMLAAFVNSATKFGRCWLFGAPGSGKSRLALEWLLDLEEQRTRLGRQAFDLAFLTGPPKSHEQWREWQPRRPTVIAIDNVADDTAAVDALIAGLCERGERLSRRVRLLLVERSRPEPLRHFDERELFRQYREAQCPITLPPLSEEQVIRAVESLPDSNAGSLAGADREGIVGISEGMPLFAIMARQSMTARSAGSTLDRGGILHDQVQRTRGKFVSHGLPAEAWPVLALATLCRGVAWSAASSFGLSQKDKGALDAALGENTAEIIPPLKPDILGEAFLLDQFADTIKPDRERLLQTAWSFAPERVHRTLFNLYLDFAGSEVLESVDRQPEEKDAEAWLWWGRVRVYLMARETIEGRFESHWQMLRNATAALPAMREAQLALAEGAVVAAVFYGEQRRWREMAAAHDELRVVAGRFPDNAEIQLQLSGGAFNAALHHGAQQRWQEMAAAHDELRVVAGRFPDNAEIQLALARGAVNAAWHYGEQQRWREMTTAHDELRAVAARFPDNAETQLWLARGAVNAALDYGGHERWAEMAAAHDELRVVAGRFPTNVAVQEIYAQGLFNQIAGQQQGGILPSSAKAREELRRLAKEFPHSLKI